MSEAKKIKLEPTAMEIIERDPDEEEIWAEEAASAMINTLKSKNNNIDDLKIALENPDQTTKCITVSQYLGGEFQRFNRENLPTHMISCRIWRWPDLKSPEQLKRQDVCERFSGASAAKFNEVCINPYHYDRLDESTLSTDFSYDNSKPGPSGMHLKKKHDVLYAANIDRQLINEDIIRQQSINPLERLITTENDVTKFPDPSPWASITYYEQTHKVGDVFFCQAGSITVDGLTNVDRTSNRLSIGHLNNIHRTPIVENTRIYIGRGVRLTYLNGMVYAENISKSLIFINSVLLDQFPSHKVDTISPGQLILIFDNEKFTHLIKERVRSGSYAAVFNLHKICTHRLSFARGWGTNELVDKASSAPCWIEIQLHCPLLWLDKVLRQMESPDSRNVNDTITLE